MILGWFVTAMGPILLSVCFWILVQRVNARWLIHLIFVPIAIAIFVGGQALFLYGANTNGVNSPDGYSLIMGSLLLILSVIVHVIASATEGVRAIKLRYIGG